MRIKKKHVLLESLLIDVTTEFTPVEKKIFKMLNKHYGNPIKGGEGKKEYTQWEVGAWLIETLDLSFQDAYSLSKTYFWSYDKLFSDAPTLRKKVSLPYLFFEHFRDLQDKIKDSYNEEPIGNVVIDFDRDSGFESNRGVLFWSGFKGFTLYITMDSGPIGDTYLYSRQTDPRLIMVRGKYYPITKDKHKKDGYVSDKDWDEEIDQEEFLVSVSVEVGRSDGPYSKTIEDFMEFIVPYPKPLNYSNFKKTNESIVGDVIKKLGNTIFNLHPEVGQINVNNQPD
jgi:hypothetical protein